MFLLWWHYFYFRETLTKKKEKPKSSGKEKQAKKERPYQEKYDVVDGKHVCPVCCKLRTKGYMSVHLKTHNKMFKCEECDKEFPQRILLRRHVSTDHDKGFGCDVCKKKFTTLSALKLHLNVHTDLYDCNLCKEKFSTERKLKCHKIREHTKRIRCKFCSKFFTDVKMLKKHELKHRVEQFLGPEPKKKEMVKKKPVKQIKKTKVEKQKESTFQCDECGVIFTALSALELHRKVHEDNTKSSTVTK